RSSEWFLLCVCVSWLQAALKALHLSLQIVGAFHDIVAYLLAFAQLGNSPSSFCALNPEPLTPDWGGTGRIGTELQEIQRMIDSLQNPQDPSEVAQLLAAHRDVMFLQFDAAIRHRLRETFLSSGNVSAYQSITDRMYHALPPLSNSVIPSVFAAQLRLPQLLDVQSCRVSKKSTLNDTGKKAGVMLREVKTLMHFPWRTFLMDGGLFPVTINNTINLNYNMQVLMEILHPAMKAIARQAGIEEDFREPVTSTQYVIPPRGVSEIDMKVYQVRGELLMDALQSSRYHGGYYGSVWKMWMSGCGLQQHLLLVEGELWKHKVMQENFSVVRPQIVETFVQRLMENYEESDTEVTFKKSHLQQCLTMLGCDIMARERSNFETYSMFYENILQQLHRLLYQKEQELHAVKDGDNQNDTSLTQIAGLSHEMIMEITALRAQLADLEDENAGLKEKIRKEVRDEYEPLVRSLFGTCVHLKGKLDVYRLSIEQRMLEIISEVRREEADNMIDLKKKFGSPETNDDLEEHLTKVRKQISLSVNEHKDSIVTKQEKRMDVDHY
ncbi:UNVERIFIED_CONTAM: hypothetical protein H355_008316, partial [Colinus virginianus]